ncbi:hypothetical protein PHYBLDRAFT_163923 [Phycomyces blakesleeanus NRRL 1555(-)]|uniref:C2H2-type zinc finger transcription factor n=1 Tax=Phycomyces blakesleeanus (strain ATCC 8743b / DSM 1359 / FGSC 10004 / NBRC 33097 / NRRL 1555) TaxID=763407 RepID=A0A163EIG2_PHYB8|nr:hypothetical protein PHYBLDRAFT_163923 [Phycomyces blakesleeanus NRRL 1555(-)]OAD78830.1 hypothetical protein PHYBLDRAFT_163923 [Phycomyces blakesleeanus NRRL 1555(-)]|eukprot:XP_018296870.1 hypothetical protein PHYBLDRAFT_163923 [Phycomyces blakesleeanus NRRL 1555(-)]
MQSMQRAPHQFKKVKSCRAQCFKNHHRRHNDIQTSQTTPVPGQVSVVLNTVSNDTINRERADAIEDQIMNTLNSKDNDDPIMNIFSNDDNDESMGEIDLLPTPLKSKKYTSVFQG